MTFIRLFFTGRVALIENLFFRKHLLAKSATQSRPGQFFDWRDAFLGRDHYPKGYTIWMAGGGVKPGMTYGETDEFGYNAVVDRVSAHDVNVTALRLLGIDHKKLTYKFQGRNFRLTDLEGNVITKIIA